MADDLRSASFALVVLTVAALTALGVYVITARIPAAFACKTSGNPHSEICEFLGKGH